MLEHSYAVARVVLVVATAFWVVAKALLHGFLGVISGYHYYAVARVFRVVAKTLLCCF